MLRFSLLSSYLSNWSARPLKARILHVVVALVAVAVLLTLQVAAYALLFVSPNLPALDALIDYQPKIPLRVFTADNFLIGEFGEERRDFVAAKDMPTVMKNAVVAIEDYKFYDHGGVYFVGALRAAVANLGRSRSQGASTITMQVARNFLLTKNKTYTRKMQEVLLAYRIEDKLSKEQILELYMNQIYLGERAFGFGSAARIYLGKSLKDLSIAEAAMLAGLPKSPSTANPVVNPERATQRQHLVLQRMLELHYITDAQHTKALAEKIVVLNDSQRMRTHAEHAAELVRQTMFAQYKEETYTRGLNVYTTLNKADQDAAYASVRRGVLDYDRRHGYRGPEAFIELPRDADAREQDIDEALVDYPTSGELQSAIVIAASAKAVRAQILSGEVIDITGEGLRFAAASLNAKAAAAVAIRPGAVIRVSQDAKKKWSVMQLPEVAAAFVSVNAQDGGIRAMVGGFDFNLSQFDHVTQAWRQPGSTIKPFIYSSALEKGFSPSTLINDAQLADDSGGEGQGWNPGNDDGNYEGPVTMRTGLKKSKNLVSIRILRAVTPPYAQDFITRFGFEASKHPANLTMVLGTGSVTPLQMAGGYAVFANGGYQVPPFLISKVVDGRGNVLSEATPVSAGTETARVLDARNAFIMDSMMRDVTRSGTAYSASQKLGRNDLAGKTGTTNDAMDGWFAGYSGDVVAVAWMGYDKPRSLGTREFGGTLALPIWIDYMRTALKGKPEFQRPVPSGVSQVEGDWMYNEYATGDSVRSLGIDVQKNFWEKWFDSPTPDAAPHAPSKQDEKERRRIEDIFRG